METDSVQSTAVPMGSRYSVTKELHDDSVNNVSKFQDILNVETHIEFCRNDRYAEIDPSAALNDASEDGPENSDILDDISKDISELNVVTPLSDMTVSIPKVAVEMQSEVSNIVQLKDTVEHTGELETSKNVGHAKSTELCVRISSSLNETCNSSSNDDFLMVEKRSDGTSFNEFQLESRSEGDCRKDDRSDNEKTVSLDPSNIVDHRPVSSNTSLFNRGTFPRIAMKDSSNIMVIRKLQKELEMSRGIIGNVKNECNPESNKFTKKETKVIKTKKEGTVFKNKKEGKVVKNKKEGKVVKNKKEGTVFKSKKEGKVVKNKKKGKVVKNKKEGRAVKNKKEKEEIKNNKETILKKVENVYSESVRETSNSCNEILCPTDMKLKTAEVCLIRIEKSILKKKGLILGNNCTDIEVTGMQERNIPPILHEAAIGKEMYCTNSVVNDIQEKNNSFIECEAALGKGPLNLGDLFCARISEVKCKSANINRSEKTEKIMTNNDISKQHMAREPTNPLNSQSDDGYSSGTAVSTLLKKNQSVEPTTGDECCDTLVRMKESKKNRINKNTSVNFQKREIQTKDKGAGLKTARVCIMKIDDRVLSKYGYDPKCLKAVDTGKQLHDILNPHTGIDCNVHEEGTRPLLSNQQPILKQTVRVLVSRIDDICSATTQCALKSSLPIAVLNNKRKFTSPQEIRENEVLKYSNINSKCKKMARVSVTRVDDAVLSKHNAFFKECYYQNKTENQIKRKPTELVSNKAPNSTSKGIACCNNVSSNKQIVIDPHKCTVVVQKIGIETQSGQDSNTHVNKIAYDHSEENVCVNDEPVFLKHVRVRLNKLDDTMA